MTLTLGTHYKYDEFGRYYYLTPTGAELITGIDTLDNDWKNVDWRLKSQGRLNKYLMQYCPNDDTTTYYSRKDYIEYAQYTFEDKRDSVLRLLGELAEWSWDSDGDRIAYEDKGALEIINKLPFTMREEGRASGMLDMTPNSFAIPEDEYQVGY